MKEGIRLLVGPLMLGLALAHAPQAAAQQRDVDFDWILNTVDTLIGTLAEGFNFPLANVDNDSNGINDDDALAALSVILRGEGREGTGISAADVAQIQADYANNRLAANNDMRVEGLCWLVNLGGYPCRLTELLDLPDILGPDLGPVVGELLLDLVAGYATIGDNPATFDAVNAFLDAVLEALKDTLDPSLANLVDLVKEDLFIEPGDYARWGAAQSSGRRNAFGNAGNLDNVADGTSNLVEYSAAADREAWLTGLGMTPPVRITTQPAATTLNDGDTLNLTVNWVGGTPPFIVQWEDASDFADSENTTDYGIVVLTAPQNIGATTTATYSVPVTLADDGIAPWLRITDAVTTYNTLPATLRPTHPPIPASRLALPPQLEFDGFGGRSSVPAVVTVTPAPITAGVTPAGPVNLVVGQSLNLTAVPGGGVPPYTYEWIFGATAGTMTPIAPTQNGIALNIGSVQVSNAGFYAVRVTADDGLDAKALQTVESAPVQVTVINPPITSSATVTGPLSIQVVFSQNMNTGGGANGAGNAANYTISGPGQGTLANSPSSASASGTTATLTWASGEMNSSGPITVTVNAAVQSAGGVPMGTPRVVATGNNGQGTAPVPVITPNQGTPTNANPITFSVNFGEVVQGFVSGDVDVSGGSAVVTPVGNAQNFTIAVTPSGTAGAVSVTVPAGMAQDLAGNFNVAGGPSSRDYDYEAPTPVVSTGVANPTNANPIPFTVDFGEVVNGFGLASIDVDNGTASNIAPVGSASSYTFDVTPTGDGLVEVSVLGVGITDASGNVSGNSNTESRTYDGTPPQPVISTTASDPTDTAPIPFTVDFGEAMTGVINTDIVVTGGSRSGFTPVGNGVFTFNVTPSGNGTILVDVPAAAGTDAAGNASLAAAQFSIDFNSPRPTVSLSSSAGGSGDFTNANPIPIAVQFSTAVTGFDPVGEPGDVSIVNGSLDNFQDAGNGTNYSFDVIPSSPVTTVTVTVNENAAEDIVSNGNFDASFELDYDGQAPTVLLSSTTETSPTNADSITYTIQFSEPVSGFTLASVTTSPPSGGTATASSLVDLGNGDIYTLEVVDITGDGLLGFVINPSGIQDAAGNVMANSYFTTALLVLDNTPPAITLIDPLPDTVNCGEGYTDPGATALDDEDGDVTADIVVTGAGPVPFSPPGDYVITYEVTDEAGNVATETRTITVTDNCPLQVTTNGAFIELDAGLSHTFEVTATGNLGALSYQWYKDDGNKALNLLPGEDSNTLELTDLTVGDAGDYVCVVSDQVVSVNSPTMTLQVLSGLPVAGIPALGGLALVLGAVGALVLRRRK